MKEWPANNKTVSFDGLCEDLRKAVNAAYKLTRLNAGKDIPWTGHDIGKNLKHCSMSPDEWLMAESLAYNKERDRDAMDVILGIAIQLGMEQGRRKTIEDNSIAVMALKIHAAGINSALKRFEETS